MVLGLSVGDYTDGLRGDRAVPVLPLEEMAIDDPLKPERLWLRLAIANRVDPLKNIIL